MFSFSAPARMWQIGAVAWAATIMVLLLLPGSSVPSITFWPLPLPYDKTIHGALFFIQAALLWKSFPQNAVSYQSLRQRSVRSLLIATAFGVGTEVLQLFAVERSASFWDALADACGAAICILILSLRSARFRKRAAPSLTSPKTVE